MFILQMPAKRQFVLIEKAAALESVDTLGNKAADWNREELFGLSLEENPLWFLAESLLKTVLHNIKSYT